MKQLLRYFFYEKKRLRSVPLQYIGDYSAFEITDEQRNMMLLGYARSPKEAQRLLDNSKLKTAAAYLATHPRKKRSIIDRVKSRFVSLMVRIEGGSFTHPLDYKPREERLSYTVSFEDNHENKGD